MGLGQSVLNRDTHNTRRLEKWWRGTLLCAPKRFAQDYCWRQWLSAHALCHSLLLSSLLFLSRGRPSFLRYSFFLLLFPWTRILFAFGTAIWILHDRRHFPPKTTMRVSKVNYLPLRRFSYLFGVRMTMFYIYAHTTNSLPKAHLFYFFVFTHLLRRNITNHHQGRVIISWKQWRMCLFFFKNILFLLLLSV